MVKSTMTEKSIRALKSHHQTEQAQHAIYKFCASYQTALLWCRPRLAQSVYAAVDRNFPPNSRLGIPGEAIEWMHDEYAVGGEAVDFTFAVPLGGFLLQQQQQQHITASAHHRGAAKFLRTQPHTHTFNSPLPG